MDVKLMIDARHLIPEGKRAASFPARNHPHPSTSRLAPSPGRQQIDTLMAAETPASFLRLFIAIPVPPSVRAEIGRAQSRLQRETRPGTVRWAPLDQFHITLKFLGDVSAENLAALQEILRPICASFAQLDLSARGIGFFPHTNQPRVIWAGAGDRQDHLSELHRQIDKATQPLAPTERPEKFTGHITLGRFKPGGHGGIPRLITAVSPLRDRHFGEWQASEVHLVQSQLASVRAEHLLLAAHPFRNGP
jgi:2'-5' RNA ligase